MAGMSSSCCTCRGSPSFTKNAISANSQYQPSPGGCPASVSPPWGRKASLERADQEWDQKRAPRTLEASDSPGFGGFPTWDGRPRVARKVSGAPVGSGHASDVCRAVGSIDRVSATTRSTFSSSPQLVGCTLLDQARIWALNQFGTIRTTGQICRSPQRAP